MITIRNYQVLTLFVFFAAILALSCGNGQVLDDEVANANKGPSAVLFNVDGD